MPSKRLRFEHLSMPCSTSEDRTNAGREFLRPKPKSSPAPYTQTVRQIRPGGRLGGSPTVPVPFWRFGTSRRETSLGQQQTTPLTKEWSGISLSLLLISHAPIRLRAPLNKQRQLAKRW